MNLPASELARFYERPMGEAASRLLTRQIRDLWPNTNGLDMAGLGYATTMLDEFRNDARRTLALMPAAQGATHWPATNRNLTALVDETALPLPDDSIDRLIVVHALETCESLRELLRQLWRVLAPQGRVILVVPNRRGVWAQVESTPFGHGRPWSRNQIMRLLRDSMFTPGAWRGCLHGPPIERVFAGRRAAAWERVGQRLWPRFAGVLLVEAVKQIYATPQPVPLSRRRVRLAPSAALQNEQGLLGQQIHQRRRNPLHDPAPRIENRPARNHITAS